MGKGYWYFRTLPDNRILFGGGRNLNVSQETTTALSTTPDIMGPLKEILKQVILPRQDPKIDYAWAGLMGFAPDHLPRIEKVPTQPQLIISGVKIDKMHPLTAERVVHALWLKDENPVETELEKNRFSLWATKQTNLGFGMRK